MDDLVRRIRIPLYEEQLEYVKQALSDGHLALGPHLRMLEQRLSELFGKRYVVLTANGFSSIFLALKSISTSSFEVLTSPASTCYAIVNAIRASGNTVMYSDMDLASASLDEVADHYQCAVIPDHFGRIAPPCGSGRSRVEGQLLIEDACQSFQSRMNTVSSADVLVLSLYPTKFANGIDGGVLLTDDPNVHGCAKRLMYYEDQYEFESEPRYNMKMNNINAAVALGSLDHMDEAASRLVEVYRHLSGVLDSVGMNYIAVSQAEVPTRLVVMAENNDQRDNWLRQLNGAGIQSGIELQYVCPQELKHRYPVCKTLVECNLSLPLHPLLKDLEVERIEAGIKRL